MLFYIDLLYLDNNTEKFIMIHLYNRLPALGVLNTFTVSKC